MDGAHSPSRRPSGSPPPLEQIDEINEIKPIWVTACCSYLSRRHLRKSLVFQGFFLGAAAFTSRRWRALECNVSEGEGPIPEMKEARSLPFTRKRALVCPYGLRVFS